MAAIHERVAAIEVSLAEGLREQGADIDEERRLAYVTITRPKKMLVVSWSMSRKGQARPSRFIAEMDVLAKAPDVFDNAA